MSKFKWSILCFILVFSASADALKCANEFNTTSSSRTWMSLQDAKALMQSQGIKTYKDFIDWKKSGNRPKDFPSHPQRTYKKEWISWSHFLGSEKQWMSFNEAKTFIQRQNIRTVEQFHEWSKSEQSPKDFPSHPENTYKDKWTSWGDFLGTGNISTRKKEKRDWMSFQDAKALMQSQDIRTRGQFHEWSKSKKRPKNFPSTPHQVYTNEWKGWGDFLGTGNISTSKRKWMSFQDAKALMQSQGIKTKREFQEWSKSERRPKNFPSTPYQVYINEWKGWGDFLGTGNISTRKKEKRDWMSFQDAKALMQRQGIRTRGQFQEWSKSKKRPKDFPSTPYQVYTNEWKGWGDFLGTGNISVRNRDWMSFQDAKALMQSQNIKTNTEFNEWKQAGHRPENFPSRPDQTYKDKWTSWGDFLGTRNISTRKREWMSLQDAKALMQSQGIRTFAQFQKWSKSEQRPKDFPSNPYKIYTNEWKGWGDFLGTGNISNQKRKWMSFQDAKALMQSQGIRTRGQFQEWSKSEQRPKDFPSNPNIIYKGKWRGWKNFLGTENISAGKRKEENVEI